MSLDIIEIALDELTDHADFEKLASEIMRDEGYPNIKPLGGVADDAQDAIQESFFISEGRIRVVFQYTLQENLASKFKETASKLKKAGINYQELVIVTPRKITSDRQNKMTREFRRDEGIALKVFERKTIVNRLADYSNGIFHRHFPNIEKQLDELKLRQPLLSSSKLSLLESSMLKASISFTFHKKTPRAKKAIFDYLILGLILENSSGDLTIDALCDKYSNIICGEKPDKAQVEAAINRLKTKKLVEIKGEGLKPSTLAIHTTASGTIQVNEITKSLISDIIDEMRSIAGVKFSEQDEQKIARNTRDVLAKHFQLFGIELANLVLSESTPRPVYHESVGDLIKTAKRQLPQEIGELLISTISQTFKKPTEEQAIALTDWALAYLGVEIMNLDPTLREFQATIFRNKIFVLDTDFILDCLVKECPLSNIYMNLIRTLKRLGCRVIIPDSCLEECIKHASYSQKTYYYFGRKLLSLTDSFIDEKVGNVFVKGYYYGIKNGGIQINAKFDDYIENYYESRAPYKFLKDVIHISFPEGIEILDLGTLHSGKISDEVLGKLHDELLALILRSKKSEYRKKEENEELAKTDAKLFLDVVYLNQKDAVFGSILGGSCYLITASGRYLRSAGKIGLKDVVTTRPQSLIGILDLIGDINISPSEFVDLFENPLLIYAVTQAWDDVQELVNSGIDLQGKSISRLRWDLDQGLHEKIVALKEADERAETTEDAEGESDSVYIKLIKSADSCGYGRIPELKSIMQDLERSEKGKNDISKKFEELACKYKDLEEAITHFGKKKQRYLRRLARKKHRK